MSCRLLVLQINFFTICYSVAEPEDEESDSVKAGRRRGTRWHVAGMAALLVLLIASLTFATLQHTRNQGDASLHDATFPPGVGLTADREDSADLRLNRKRR